VHTCVYVCMCVYACICIWMRMCVYDIARRIEALLLRFSMCAYVCMCIRMYMCVHVCVYRCICICMYMYTCVSVYMYAYILIYARVWVYICTRVGAFCLFVLSNLSTTCACITCVSEHCMIVCGGIGSGFVFSLFMVSACYWRGRLCFGRGRDKGFVLYISLFLRVFGWWVCVCLYTRVHTHKLLGCLCVGRTPGELEESRSTKVHCTCRPYRCTQYICLYLCCAAGFDDLG